MLRQDNSLSVFSFPPLLLAYDSESLSFFSFSWRRIFFISPIFVRTDSRILKQPVHIHEIVLLSLPNKTVKLMPLKVFNY